MERRVDRRAALGIWASGIMSAAAACKGGTTVVQTPEGPVLQLEKDEFLILVSGFKNTYFAGERVAVTVLINNQSRRFATARIRTRLLGRGQQAIAEADVATLNIRPEDAASIERALVIPRTAAAGDYTLQVELPPWSFEGRQAGGGKLETQVKVEPA